MTDEKEVEYYAAKANAWFNTKIEYDKSLLTLSAGAIGLLITLLTTVGVESIVLLFVFAGALISFIICLFSVLTIFYRNAKYLESLISGHLTSDRVLGLFDSISIISFVIGVILTAIIGLSIATTSVLTKEKLMTGKKTYVNQNVGLKDSYNGAVNIAPSGDLSKKSFNGAQNVAPPQSSGNTSSPSTNNQNSSNSGEVKK